MSVVKLKLSGKNMVRLSLGKNNPKTFFVKFYVKEFEDEFLGIMDYYQGKPEGDVKFLKLKNGSYKVFTDNADDSRYSSAWDILMHKYWSLSKQICKDSRTNEKFYAIRVSSSEIEDEGRMIV